MSTAFEFIKTLEDIIAQRKVANPDESYTAQLFAAGTARIAQKLGEEGVELALASVQGSREQITAEAADLVYHLLVLLQVHDLTLEDIATELQRRHR